MLKAGKFSDFTIICQGTEIRVHKFVLYSQSAYFAALFESNMEEARQGAVTFDDVDPELVNHLLKYFYSDYGDFDFGTSDLKTNVSFWILADRLQARQAMREIEDRLSYYLGISEYKYAVTDGTVLDMVFSNTACANSAIGEVFAEAAWDVFVNDDDAQSTKNIFSSLTKHHLLAQKMLKWCMQWAKTGI
ncbi:POZ domain-containing protein, partial [Colletotrichum falcatum]